jgi:hypothetical protein
MNRKLSLSLLMVVALIGASLKYTQSASSSSFNQHKTDPGIVLGGSNLLLPLATTFDVDRTDDTSAATACKQRRQRESCNYQSATRYYVQPYIEQHYAGERFGHGRPGHKYEPSHNDHGWRRLDWGECNHHRCQRSQHGQLTRPRVSYHRVRCHGNL